MNKVAIILRRLNGAQVKTYRDADDTRDEFDHIGMDGVARRFKATNTKDGDAEVWLETRKHHPTT